MAKYSEYQIPNLNSDWADNPTDHKPQSGMQVQTFIRKELKNRVGAAYYNPQNTTLYMFTSEEDKSAWLANPEEGSPYILATAPFSFSQELYRVALTNNTESSTIFATVNQDEVLLSLSFAVEKKQLSDIVWTPTNLGVNVSLYIDRGGTGTYEEITLPNPYISSDTGIFEFDIREHLNVGANRVRIVFDAETLENVTATFTYSITLVEMYIEPFNNTWYQAIVENGQSQYYKLGGYKIVGSLNKTLHIDLYTGTSLVKSIEKVIGMSTYVDSPYNFTKSEGLDLSDLQTGVYNAHVYLTAGTLSTATTALIYNILYIAGGDELTAEYVVMNNTSATVYNYDESAFLCDYAIYNKGLETGVPTISVIPYIDSVPQPYIPSTQPVNTNSVISLYSPIEVSTEQTNNLRVEFTVSLGEHYQRANAVVDNSAIFPAETGYALNINPAMRSNGEGNRTTIINYTQPSSQEITDVTWQRMSWIDGIDGWTNDEDGRKCLLIPAGSKLIIPTTSFKVFNGDDLSIELCYKVKNVSDYTENCITIASNPAQDSFRGIRIKPTNITVHSISDTTATNDTNRGTNIPDEETIHFIVSMSPSYAGDIGKNLVTGFINGAVAFQFEYSDGSGWNDNYADFIIGGNSCDVYLYLCRVYQNSALGISNVEHNYINSLATREEKIIQSALMESVINTSTRDITYEKISTSNNNFFVIEMLNGDQLPSNKNGSAKTDKGHANFEMHFGETPLMDFKLYNVEIGGQGTTSMNYYLWNERLRIDKSNSTKKIPVAYYDAPSISPSGTKVYHERPASESSTVFFDGGGNLLSPLHPAVKRITAKINFASSMQSHKMGATKVFNKLHDEIENGTLLNEAQIIADTAGTPRPSVAVYQYPAYGFEKTVDELGTVTYAFLGLFTIGPDKGDKPTFGWDMSEIKPNLISLEGVDHTPRMTKFSIPWDSSTIYYVNDDGDAYISRMTSGDPDNAWEVGNCQDEDTENSAVCMPILETEFKPAYDVAYKNSTLIFPIALSDDVYGGATAQEVLQNINNDVENFRAIQHDSRFKNADLEFWIEGEYILYYYDNITNSYVAGTNLVTQCGTPTGATLDEKNNFFKEYRRAQFKAHAGDYWHLPDTIFQMVFLIVFGATDNFAKNSYPYLMTSHANGGRWRWRQDDLDTIFDVDNNGGQTKPYYIEFEDTSNGEPIFAGSSSVFWNLVFECFYNDYTVNGTTMPGIKSMGRDMLRLMANLGQGTGGFLNNCVAFIKRYFWDSAQNYFTKSAYNVDAATKYIAAWRSNKSFSVEPLTQSLGSHIEAESFWVKRRILYLMSLFQMGAFYSYSDSTLGSIMFRPISLGSLTVTPSVDMYPALIIGATGIQPTERTSSGSQYTFNGLSGDGQTVFTIQATNFLRSLGDLKTLQRGASEVSPLGINGAKLTEFIIGSANANEVTTNVTGLTFANTACLELLDARNAVSLTGTLDLTNCKRLNEVYLEGTSISEVNLPAGSKITTLHLPNNVRNIVFKGVKFLEDLQLPNDKSQVTTVSLEDCDALDFIPTLYSVYTSNNSSLNLIRLIWSGNKFITDGKYFIMLANMARDRDKDGNVHMYEGLNSSGQIINHPVIQGTIVLDAPHYVDDLEEFPAVGEEITSGEYKIRQSTTFEPFTLKYKFGSSYTYIPFADAIVHDISTIKWGDTIGVTYTDALTAINSDFNNLFTDNTDIETFDEFVNFSNITGFNVVNRGGFAGCTNLKSITLPPYFTRIPGDGYRTLGFNGCSSLERVTGLNQLVEICADCFANCENLSIILNLPNLTTLGGGAFYNSGITKIENLGSVTALERNGQSGHGAFHHCQSLTEVTLSNVVTLGMSTFTDCIALTKATLPNVTSIGQNSFYGCTALVEVVTSSSPVTVDSGVFQNCTSLTNVHNLKLTGTVGARAFANCSALEGEIDLAGCTAVNASAFNGCTNLTLKNTGNLISIDQNAFSGSNLYNPVLNNVEVFANNALVNVSGLGDITLDSVTSFGASVFNNSDVHSVIFTENVDIPSRSLPGNTFRNCTNLVSVTLPSTINIIEAECFYNCTALESINLQYVTAISAQAFLGSGLRSITLNSGLTLRPNTFGVGSHFQNCLSLETVDLGNITSLPNNCFKDCTALTTISNFEAITTLGLEVFRGCSSLDIAELNLPNLAEFIDSASNIGHCFYQNKIRLIRNLGTITRLPASTFASNQFMTAAILPPTLTEIARDAFNSNIRLDNLIIRATTPPTLTTAGIFFNCPLTSIFVPAGSLTNYQVTTNWSTFASRMREYNEVSALPIDNTNGDYCFLNVDNSLYEWQSTTWVKII